MPIPKSDDYLKENTGWKNVFIAAYRNILCIHHLQNSTKNL